MERNWQAELCLCSDYNQLIGEWVHCCTLLFLVRRSESLIKRNTNMQPSTLNRWTCFCWFRVLLFLFLLFSYGDSRCLYRWLTLSIAHQLQQLTSHGSPGLNYTSIHFSPCLLFGNKSRYIISCVHVAVNIIIITNSFIEIEITYHRFIIGWF